MKRQELISAIHHEWRNMHHNASISKYYPDFQNEYEGYIFWELLASCVPDEILELAEDIQDKWGVHLTFYQYGRNGASIAPSQWSQSVGGSGLGILLYSVLSDYSGIEEHNENYRILQILKYINEFWRLRAEDVQQWWDETKEQLELQSKIDAHEGMALVTKRVWE